MSKLALLGALMAGGGGSTGASWNLSTFLGKLRTNLEGWMETAFIVVGLVMVGVGVYKAAKKLIQGQGAGAQISWVTIIALLGVGAALTVVGVNGVIGLGQGVVETVGTMGGT